MSDEYLHCWQWDKIVDGDSVGLGVWGHYPATFEHHDSHEVMIVFWEAPERGGSDE